MGQLLWVIFQKETIDNLRDRRSVFNTLFSVLFNPVLYIFLFGFISRSTVQQVEQLLNLPVVGAEHAPNLIQYLRQNNIEIVAAPENIDGALLAGDVTAVLMIPESFGESLQAGEVAFLELKYDDSNQSSNIPVRRIERLVEQYGRQVGSLRLLARGINPGIMTPFSLQKVNISPRGTFGSLLSLLPVIMITAAFFGGFSLVVDMIAGERERESLEPLLLNPVPRSLLVMGKYGTAVLFTVMAMSLATATFLILLALPIVQEFTKIRLNLEPTLIVTAVSLMIPVVFMAVGLQMFISSYAKSVKEAQTYSQLMSMIGFLPPLFLSILPIKEQFWMGLVPAVSQTFLINRVARGESLVWGDVWIASGITMLVAAVAIWGALRLFQREQIVLFGE